MTKICIEFDPDSTTPEPPLATYAATIGDGTTTSFSLPHGLDTADVLYSLRNLATGELDGYDVTVSATPAALSLVFATAPAPSSVRVVVVAA